MSVRKRFEPIIEPWMRRSRRKSKPCSSIFVPNGIMPMIVAVPPWRRQANDCSAVCFRPMHSNAYCTPPPVSCRICSTASPADASTTSVAPNTRARSNLNGSRSTAITRAAPASTAALIADSPMPPAPNTATVDPGSTFAVWTTAP